MKKYLLISLLILPYCLQAQYGNMPLTISHSNAYADEIYHTDKEIHTSIQPWSSFEVGTIADSVYGEWQIDKPFFKNTWFGRKLVNEPFIRIKKEDYTIIANPILNVSTGYDSQWEDRTPYRNTRGFQLMGNVGESFTFYSDFYENQALFPKYIYDYVEQNNIIPGEGKYKPFKDSGAKDFAYANAYLTYQPNKVFNFQFGHGKHFLGDGYRSLLLSDNAFNYPYLRLTAELWKLKYMVLYTKMLDIRKRNPDNTFINKYVTTHYLSINITKRLNVGLFETVIYGDSLGTRGYDVNYLNPIIFYRPIEFSLGSAAGNALLGLNIRYKVTNDMYVYGQFLLDEFKLSEIRARSGWWANKYGFQLGIKSFNTFIDGLTIQSEVNMVRPYTYSHFDVFQNYAHYNQALAHPLGSNFIESVSFIHYHKGRWFGEMELLYAIQGMDTYGAQNWGTDVYKDYNTREQDYDNETLQGLKTSTIYVDTKAGWIVNPSYNLRLELGYTFRQSTPELQVASAPLQQTHYIYIGLATRLNHTNRDAIN